MKPLVLLSNDDGYASAGLQAMRRALDDCDVVVVAPEREQSASSHALSLRSPLRLRAIAPDTFALDGTPADCVYVALHAGNRILPRRPDLVVSGINHGLNLGQDAFYSGTVAAAREAALRGIHALATSTHHSLDLSRVATASARIAHSLITAGNSHKDGLLLSVNFPKEWSGGMRATRMGTRIYEERVHFRADPYGREYLWLGGPGVHHEKMAGSDTDAYDEGIASITPLALDLTSAKDMPLAETVARASFAETR
jgi:5'-nucleotidase